MSNNDVVFKDSMLIFVLLKMYLTAKKTIQCKVNSPYEQFWSNTNYHAGEIEHVHACVSTSTQFQCTWMNDLLIHPQWVP